MSALRVEMPATYGPERTYAVTMVFDELLGIPAEIDVVEGAHETRVTVGDGRVLVLPDGFFAIPDDRWLQPASVPDLVVGDLPSLPSAGPTTVEPDRIVLGTDVLGVAFFLLTRYEEVARPQADSHGRFPLSASVSREHIARPLVDEHVELLWSHLQRLWPRLTRRPKSFSIVATHDVDHAFAYASCSAKGMARLTARRLVLERAVRPAGRTPLDWLAVQRGRLDRDPFNTYDAIMDDCERAGVACAFYVIPDPSLGGRDPKHLYDLEDPRVIGVLRRITERGHEVGVHPSYRSHLDPVQLAAEVDGLRQALSRNRIAAEVRGGRQHYLRWSAERSWGMWEDCGLAYDSTVGYAEAPGFRSGTCHSHPVFALRERRALALRERPLVIMERTLEDYLSLDLAGEEVRSRVEELKRRTRRHGGELVVLWHNSSLSDPRHRSLYRETISA